MPAVKRIPQRKCLGCGASKNKNELIRVVRSPENEISIDLKGKKSGRGAYICHDVNCLKKAVKAKRFDKNLEVKISDEILESLTEQIKTENSTEVH
ncbi:MAG: YlxR family protein [Oscillospiraceae bacterium]|nr:YlxR family protein [Oscillospiraceae bacterium]